MDLVQGMAGRIYPVGRLDADSAGLLLLTNDGDFTQTLTHPSHQVPRTYRAVVRGMVPEWAGADLSKGIVLEDGMTAPAEVMWVDYDEQNNASIIDITIHEGRNRQVRRMFDAIGYPVLALTRMRIGPIELKGLAPGTWRKLHPSEVRALLETADTAPTALPQSPIDRPEDFQPRQHDDEQLEDRLPKRNERNSREERPGRSSPAARPRNERAAPGVNRAPAWSGVRATTAMPATPPTPARTQDVKLNVKPSVRQAGDPRIDAHREEARNLAARLNAVPDEEIEETSLERKPIAKPRPHKGPRNRP